MLYDVNIRIKASLMFIFLKKQVGKDGHYQTAQGTTTGPTLIVQTTGGPVLQVTMEPAPHVGVAPVPAKKPKSSVKLKKASAASAAAAAAATATATAASAQNSASAGGAKPVESTWVESDDLLPWNSSKVASYNATHKVTTIPLPSRPADH